MFNISFEFNEETKKVSNVKVTEVKTKEKLVDGAFVSVLDNKLEFTKDAIALLGVTAGERLSINYYTVDNENTFPVIGKSEVFTDDTDGNKLNKSNTISFRGERRNVLLEYGSVFKIVEFKDGMFKLEPQETETQEEFESKSVETAKADLDDFVEKLRLNINKSNSTDEEPF